MNLYYIQYNLVMQLWNIKTYQIKNRKYTQLRPFFLPVNQFLIVGAVAAAAAVQYPPTTCT